MELVSRIWVSQGHRKPIPQITTTIRIPGKGQGFWQALPLASAIAVWAIVIVKVMGLVTPVVERLPVVYVGKG